MMSWVIERQRRDQGSSFISQLLRQYKVATKAEVGSFRCSRECTQRV